MKLCTSEAFNVCFPRIDVTGRPGDVETRKATTTYTLGTGLQHQQVGNVWSSPDTIVSLSFSGDLNVFDRRSGEKPVKVLHVCDNITPKVELRVLLNISVFVGSSESRHLCYLESHRTRDVLCRVRRWSGALLRSYRGSGTASRPGTHEPRFRTHRHAGR